MWRNLHNKNNCSVRWSCDISREKVRVENFGGKRVMHTKFSLKCEGAHLGDEVGSVNVHSVLHKKGIVNCMVTAVSEFIFYTSQLRVHIKI
jgi:hypothetical protein